MMPVQADASADGRAIIVSVGNSKKSEAKKLYELLNKKRKAKGLNTLSTNDLLDNMAMERALELTAYNSHTRPGGGNYADLKYGYNVTYTSLIEECIAVGYNTAQEAFNYWMSKDSNKAIFKEKILGNVGTACYEYMGVKHWVLYYMNAYIGGMDVEPVPEGEVYGMYYIDTNVVKGCSIEFLEPSIYLEMGKSAEYDLLMYDKSDKLLGAVLDYELMHSYEPDTMKVYVNESMIYAEKSGPEKDYRITTQIGDLKATKTVKVRCPHPSDKSETVTVPSTCTVAGSKTVTCKNCGKVTTEALPLLAHTLKEGGKPDETSGGHYRICSVCEKEIFEKHQEEWVLDKEATEQEAGLKHKHCKICGYESDFDTPVRYIRRISGGHRFETALYTADVLKQEKRMEQYDAVLIASGTNFADALAGSYLAVVKNAPILMSSGMAAIDAAMYEYIETNLAEQGTVYILGGTSAVSEAVEEKLSNYNVVRLGGKTRFETNLAILEEAGIEDEDIIIATGINYADSLSASSLGKPILLVGNTLTAEQKELLGGLSGNKIYIIGGTGAVKQAVEDEAGQYGDVKRLSGAHRYDTSILIAKEFFQDVDHVVWAYGKNFPDGLSGGPLAYNMKSPLILVSDDYKIHAADYVKENNLFFGTVLGGTGVIKDETVGAMYGFDVKDNFDKIVTWGK